MPHLRHLLLCACVFVVGCSRDPSQSLTSPSNTNGGTAQTDAKGGTHLPLHGSLQTFETERVEFPTVFVQSTGEGTATHLGRFTLTFNVVVTLPAGTAIGEFTFVAANGDTLLATFTGQATPTAEPGVVSIHEVATITGGTGRFAGATGSF